jgi:hypothetical protein
MILIEMVMVMVQVLVMVNDDGDRAEPGQGPRMLHTSSSLAISDAVISLCCHAVISLCFSLPLLTAIYF